MKKLDLKSVVSATSLQYCCYTTCEIQKSWFGLLPQ